MTTISFSESLYLNNTDGLSYSIDNKNTWSAIISYPVTIIYDGSTTGNIYLESDLAFTSLDNYFIFDSQNIIFNGQFNSISIRGVVNYPGLFQNEIDPNTGNVNAIVKDIMISCSTRGSIPGFLD